MGSGSARREAIDPDRAAPTWQLPPAWPAAALLLLVWLGIQGDLSNLTTLSAYQWAWLALTGSTLSIFVLTWYTALSLAPAVDVTAILVLGAVITGLLNTGFRGVPLTIESTGYVLLALGAVVIAIGRPRPIARTTAT